MTDKDQHSACYFETVNRWQAGLLYYNIDFNTEDDTMKCRVLNAAWLLLCIILLGGCASQMSYEDLGSQWIARPLAELKQKMEDPGSYASKIEWKETTYPLRDGDYVFVEPIGADCSIHWKINQKDIIIGYQPKGKGCPRGTGPDSILNTPMRGW
jgi:hypothetical protein